MTDITDVADAFNTDEVEALRSDAMETVMDAVAERMEKELYGAWRAGFKYVHVYQMLDYGGLRLETFSVKQAVVPSHTENPPKHPSAQYLHTYDLTDVPAAALRKAWRDRDA